MEEGAGENAEGEGRIQLVSQIAADPNAVQELARARFPPLLASLEQLAEKNREKQGEHRGTTPENRDGAGAAIISGSSSSQQESPAAK